MDNLLTNSGSENTTMSDLTSVVTKRTSSRIPRSDANLLGMAKSILKTWEKNQAISMIWISFDDFTKKVTEFDTLINQNSNARNKRSPISYQLGLMDRAIDEKLSYVKNAIKNYYGIKNASSYYSSFGIEKRSRGYILPHDRQKRILALQKMKEGVTNINLESDKFGIAFWTDIYDKYNNLISQTTDSVQDFSQIKSNKEVLKEEIITTLKSLIFVIKANYPHTWEDQLRVWGFLKEIF